VPELPVQEVRVSELHLPEIKRDEIVRSLSEVRLPALDLATIERPRIALPDSIRRFDWRSIDLGGALAGAAAIARLGRPLARRSRWTYVAGAVIVVGAASAVILASPAIRERAGRTIRDLRARIDERTGPRDGLEIDIDAAPAVEALDASIESLETTTASLDADGIAATATATATAESETQPDEGSTPMVDMAVAGGTAVSSDDGANGSS
jgi:hypothetical protein